MKTWLMSFVALLFACAWCRGDEEVRRVQEELRRRMVYFGEIDGRRTDELNGAVRRYQERKGFAATGQIDGNLLRSLGLSAPLIVTAAWPETPVLKSDAAREIAESDRFLLERLADSPEAKQELGKVEGGAAESNKEGKGGNLETEEPKPSLPPPSRKGAEKPEVEPPAPPVALEPVSEPLTQQAESFVREYLAACETNQLPAEMAFYADHVDYFDHGLVDRKFIEKDVGRYYRRWPKRDFELLDFKLARISRESLEVRFRIAFRVANADHTVPGRTMNTFKIRRNGGEMRFVSLREQRLTE